MACYFIRETKEDLCTKCGMCVDVCPVNALKLENDAVIFNQEWCIGCNICVSACHTGAAKIWLRADRTGDLHAVRLKQLHQMILQNKA